jgi:hypothetical protein
MSLSEWRKASPFARTRVNAKAALRLAVRRLRGSAVRPVAKDVIVSFTAIPPRMPTVHLVVDSLLLQTVLPERIVLYLSTADFPDRAVLRKVEARVGARFSIRWLDTNLGSYRKLVHALEEFPGRTIITVDDDKIYAAGAIESLLSTARRYPRTVVFRQGFSILPRDPETGRLPSIEGGPGYWHLPVGVGGILYPPGSLGSDVTDETLFMRLAPHADDIWFKAMALLTGTPAVLARPAGGQDHSLWFRWTESLSYHNSTLHKWESQLAATFGHYGLVPGVDPARPSLAADSALDEPG